MKVPVEAHLIAAAAVRTLRRVAHPDHRPLLLRPDVVAVPDHEGHRERRRLPIRHRRVRDHLMPRRRDRQRHPDHRGKLPGPARPARVDHPLRLDHPPHRLHPEPGAARLDPQHLAVFLDLHPGPHRREGDIARHQRRMDIAIGRAVRRPGKPVPSKPWKPVRPLRWLDPLGRQPVGGMEHEVPPVTHRLLRGGRHHEVPRLHKAAIQPDLLADPQVQLAGAPPQHDRRRRPALLADHPRRAARRPPPGPTPLQHDHPANALVGQRIRRPQPQVAPADDRDVVPARPAALRHRYLSR